MIPKYIQVLAHKPVNITFYDKRYFFFPANMIKWKILSGGEYPRFYAWTLSVIASVLIRKRLRKSFDIE